MLAWREWVDAEDGWYGLLHGEMLCRVTWTNDCDYD